MKSFILSSVTAALAVTAIPSVAPAQRADRVERNDHQGVYDADRDYREANRDYRKDRRDDRRYDRRRERQRMAWQDYKRYDYDRTDPRYGNYSAERYYRDGSYYRPRRLSYDDRVYRGQNGNYYCRRSDGTTGLLIGGAVGGLLGNSIARGESKTVGTIIGAGAGALLGREVERGGVNCR